MEIRAYRGSRRASTYDEHVLPEHLFGRMVLLASAYDLHQLSTRDPYGPTELYGEQAQRIAEEVRFIGSIGTTRCSPRTWLLSVAYAAHPGESWLVIEGP